MKSKKLMKDKTKQQLAVSFFLVKGWTEFSIFFTPFLMTSLCLRKKGSGWQPDLSLRVRAAPPPPLPPFRLSIDAEIPVVDPLWHLPGDSRLFKKTGRRRLSNATKPRKKNYTPRTASQRWQPRSPSLFLFFFYFLYVVVVFFSSFFSYPDTNMQEGAGACKQQHMFSTSECHRTCQLTVKWHHVSLHNVLKGQNLLSFCAVFTIKQPEMRGSTIRSSTCSTLRFVANTRQPN